MALIICPECGKEISDQAPACIHCGFPLSASKPTDAPLVAPIRSKKPLWIAFGIFCVLLALGACIAGYFLWYSPNYIPQQVTDYPCFVPLNGAEAKCQFTGTMLAGLPQGDGIYVFQGENQEWSYTGMISDEGILVNGSVENMPVIMDTPNGPYQTVYTGSIENDQLLDSYHVTDMPILCTCDHVEIIGFYTGTIYNQLPNGQGFFSYQDREKYFFYEGGWNNGNLSGKGSLECNIIEVHFAEVDRLGVYKGDVVDGVFCGNGTCASWV